ncbi:regulator of deoxyribodipyrimidine photo-lyase PHR1 [Ophiocordyceps sinensis CO18]|uniref:[histone H3]-trimethyl-L-lysine(9) demethylase n=1 Tax=Ophiocordyceps sinensis (strain Co18 / CGMCC 3.14243) TaxID=911162 RepID=T5AB88_OPHSC|nr:regulator of deoxyribodipyrimidine photo-lyase PHR1 [Ophiocordyceps sinensis CO18]
MSTAAASDPAAVDAEPGLGSGPVPIAAPDALDAKEQIECAKPPAPAFLYSPPDSNDAAKTDATDSELSDLDDEPVLDGPPPAPASMPLEPQPTKDSETDKQKEDQDHDDIGEVLPDHWSANVPVFRPTMHQFKDFQRFMKKVDGYGMKSGIIKIIPPPEWKSAQPPLDDLVKYIKVREPIKQDIMGSNGTYRQVNILHGRSYNVPQWRQLCEQSEHQPPARRGERRANADKPKPPRTRASAASKSTKPSTPKKRGKGRPAKGRGKQSQNKDEERPMTPVSPREEPQDIKDEPVDSIERDAADEADEDDCQPSAERMGGRMGGARPAKPKTQSVSARRKYSRREGSAMIDEAAFKDFDYRMDVSDYTPERCEELERAYWKTLTYASPLYGADLMGTLFDDRTDIWNLNKLPNLLDVLGTKVPGVNTAYLYLGMWKATFAWHLEDVDLYSINYLHFGAPKQWYSISQADARRFEAAMRNIWPTDAKACDQFLRHKGFLISPHQLLQHYGIKVNKVVSYPGEFVVTYPYGYHSGYNLGYNCAEAVNFALDSWLPMGKIAKKCECAQAQDSVWINVYEVERKLRGEETEYEETEDEEDDDGDGDGDMSGLPTPPASHGVRFKDINRKRKRGLPGKRDKVKVKKIKLRLKAKAEPPCCLCPHDVPGLDMLPTEDGRKAHRMCALYMPETYVDTVDDKEVIFNVTGISKDRLDLKCLFCRSKHGACVQCTKKKCARSYHATCAAAAGVFVEEQDVPVFVDDGTEFKERAFEFNCRFHRVRRDKKTDGDALETDERLRAAAEALKKGEICQFQRYRGEIFAGMVVENRVEEQMVLIDVLPNGDRVEVEWKWLLLPDPADFHLPRASAKALPMPASRKAQDQLKARRLHDDKPKRDDAFADGYTWAEFQLEPVTNKDQVRIDFSKPDQTWHYLGKTSTDARAQYTEDPTKQRHNPKGNFLDTIPKPPKPAPAPRSAARPRPRPVAGPAGGYAYSFNHHPGPHPGPPTSTAAGRLDDKPYVYKPKIHTGPHLAPLMYAPQNVTPSAVQPSSSLPHGTPYQHSDNMTRASYPTNMHALTQAPLQPASHAAVPNLQRPSAGPYQKTASINPSRPTWQVHSSVYCRYPFFQVNHNRDSTKYRTPYAPGGGFTNGYEGDLRAHLMSRQSDLLRRPGLNPVLWPISTGPSHGPSESHGAGHLERRGDGFPARTKPQTPAAPPPMQPRMPLPPVPGVSVHPLHPAPQPWDGVASQYYCPPSQQPPAQVPRAKAPAAQKPSKVGLPAAVSLALKSTKPTTQNLPKQSPVPLPANFLAAMASSPSGTLMGTGLTPGPGPSQAWAGMEPVTRPFHAHADADAAAAGPGPQAYSAQAAGTARPHAPALRLPSMSLGPVASQDAGWRAETSPLVEQGPGPVSTQFRGGPRSHVQGSSESPGNQTGSAGHIKQEFSDVPGCESMRFVERMMENLKRASQRGSGDGGA